ncbi:MAG: hypothetical protein JWP47_2720 [Polaromonas sp.]|nr:hypothetical protein [Polaromonas sp.]
MVAASSKVFADARRVCPATDSSTIRSTIIVGKMDASISTERDRAQASSSVQVLSSSYRPRVAHHQPVTSTDDESSSRLACFLRVGDKSRTIAGDGPSRMVKRPTGSGGEPSSPNCGASAGVKARHLIFKHSELQFACTMVSSNQCLATFPCSACYRIRTTTTPIKATAGHRAEAPAWPAVSRLETDA